MSLPCCALSAEEGKRVHSETYYKNMATTPWIKRKKFEDSSNDVRPSLSIVTMNEAASIVLVIIMRMGLTFKLLKQQKDTKKAMQ